MVDRDVDLLLSYLDAFPELEKHFKRSPPRVFCRDRWRTVREVKKLSSGLEVRCSGRGKLQLVPEHCVSHGRENQKQRLLTLIETHLDDGQLIKVLDKTDRNRHQTEAIIRVLLRVGDKSVAVMGVYENETSELTSRLLSSIILWWDQLGGVNLAAVFIPDKWSERVLELLPFLTIPVVCYKYHLDAGKVRQIYPLAGKLSRVDSPYVIYPMISEAPKMLTELGRAYPSVDLLFRHGKWELSYRGLPVAWVDENNIALFDLQRPKRIKRISSVRAHIRQVMDYRRFPSPNANHLYYRFGGERWLESIVLRDHRRINPEFSSQIYNQVPTLVGFDRKVLDLLTVTNQGRLAVMEIKTQKELGLLFQGLDYWERVEHHRSRCDFRPAGYFSGIELAEEPPLLYLVCPLFEFHHVLVVLRRYLRKDFKIRCVGINADWRRKLKILRQFEL